MNKSEEQTYPSVECAYEIALKSYDMAIQRSDEIDDRIDKVLTWISTITLGVVTIIATKSIPASFTSHWFYGMMGLFGVASLLGILAKAKGSLVLISPKTLYEKWLHFKEWEFKKNTIYWAGKHFSENQRFVNWKGKISVAMIVIFVFQIVVMITWLISLS